MEYGWSIRLAGLAPAGLIAACLAGPSADDEHDGPTAAEMPVQSAALAPIDWSRGDCLSQLRTLQQAASDGRLGPADRPPFAVQLVAAPGEWLDAVPQLPIEADLPLAIDDAGPAGGARCVLRIGPARDQDAAHRAVDIQDVRSAYQSSSRSERNPDYDAAQMALREAKQDANGGHRVVRVGDPLLDLVGTAVGGLIGTVDHGLRQQDVDEAAAALATTPRSHDRPVYRPYSFERVVVRAQKQAVVPVALLDGSGRELRATELRQSERRELFVLRGLDPRDRDYEQHRSSSMSEAELARWARTPPALRLSSVAVALTEGAPAAEARLAEIAPAAGPAVAEPISVAPEPELWPQEAALTEDLADPWRADAFAAKAWPPGPEPAVRTRHRMPGRRARSACRRSAGRERGRDPRRQGRRPRLLPARGSGPDHLPAGPRGLGGRRHHRRWRDRAGAGRSPRSGARSGPAAGAAAGAAAVLYLDAPAPTLPPGAGEPGLPVLWNGEVVGMTTALAALPAMAWLRAPRSRPFSTARPPCSRRFPRTAGGTRTPPCRSTIVDAYRDGSNNEMSG